jgi:hypothetical protein
MMLVLLASRAGEPNADKPLSVRSGKSTVHSWPIINGLGIFIAPATPRVLGARELQVAIHSPAHAGRDHNPTTAAPSTLTILMNT